jgi:hypothetical protein
MIPMLTAFLPASAPSDNDWARRAQRSTDLRAPSIVRDGTSGERALQPAS